VTATARAVFAVLHLDADVVRAMDALVESREDAATCLLRRPTVTGEVATMTTIGTGVGPARHGAYTQLVPAMGATEGLSEAMQTADLRPMTSRDAGAPFIWNRLASRGIASAVVGWSLHEAQDEALVMELGFQNLVRISVENEVSGAETMLGALKGGLDANPDLRCFCLHAHWRDRGGAAADDADVNVEDDAEADGSDEGDDAVGERKTTPSAEEMAAGILGWLDAVRHLTGADNALVAMLGPRIGRYLLIGPRAAGLDTSFAMMPAAVPTVLDLLGEPAASDLPGQSLLAGGDSDDVTPARPSWSIEGGETRTVDFAPSIARVLAGEGGPLLKQVVQRHLTQSHWVGISEGDGEAAVEAATSLVDIEPDAINLFRLMLAQMAAGRRSDAIATAHRLRAAHPESPLAELVMVMAPMGASDQEVGEILDRLPAESLPGPLARGVRARAAARIGRDDEALEGLWRLITSGYALNHDRLSFATLAVKRNEGPDAQRAVLAMRGMSGLGTGPDGRPRSGIVLLRAKALELTGRHAAAIALLQNFNEQHPLEEQVAVALKRLREETPSAPSARAGEQESR
jgi:hypothetical protein